MFRKIIPVSIRNFSPKTYWKEILAVFIILLAFVFFRSQRKELHSIMPQLRAARSIWVIAGIVVTGIYVWLQGMMYIKSFKAIGLAIGLRDSVELFLKRNFLSVFLPAGGISSLAYTTGLLRRKKLNTTQIHQAGAIYAYVGLLTVFIIGVPVIVYTLWHNQNFGNAWISLLVLGLLLGFMYAVVYSFRNKGFLYQFVSRRFPSVLASIDNIFAANVNRRQLIETVIYSTLIEVCGILHVFIAMEALGTHHSFEAAAIGYTISVVLMIISPFLRGLGAVEFSMLYIFSAYGYSNAQSLGITILYRVFEFWLPLLLGLVSFIWRGRHLAARIGPAVAIFLLGLVNIISVATPPLAYRLRIEKVYITPEAIHASKLMVLMLGIALIVTSAYLIRGLRAAWVASIIFASLSIIGNIGKAMDYEEALLSAFIIILLVFYNNQYRVRSSVRWLRIGVSTFFIALVSVCIFDFLSFYFIDKRHFGIDFTWRQSIYHTAKSFLLFSDDELQPLTRFGRDFLNIIHFLGVFSWLMLIYALLRPSRIISRPQSETNHEIAQAMEMLKKYGRSSIDYFKTTPEKCLLFSALTEGFTSYRLANDFAVVLEEPVCAVDYKVDVLTEFEQWCKSKGLKTVYYRVDENSLLYFDELKKQKMLIGQEAIMDVDTFKLEGKDRKSLRNGLNSLQKKGYITELHTPPHRTVFLNELQQVSDEWLNKFDKREMVFSQGIFDKEMLRHQPVITVKDNEGVQQAFLNIIPDYTPEECTYDLIRRRWGAPGGCMDAMIVRLAQYARENTLKYINLGIIPLSGIDEPDNPAEQIMKYASRRVGSLKHYQKQKDFKEKYATIWENKYLVFGYDFDLVQLPVALRKVMKPDMANTN